MFLNETQEGKISMGIQDIQPILRCDRMYSKLNALEYFVDGTATVIGVHHLVFFLFYFSGFSIIYDFILLFSILLHLS